MKKIIVTMSAMMLLLLSACDGNDDNSNEKERFDVDAMLGDLTTTKIMPAITNFINEATNLEQSVTIYVASPTEANLQAVRQQWQLTALAYERTYVYHIGMARDQFIHTSIYDWPTVGGAIEFFIDDSPIIDQGLMNTIASQAKSIAAIEYLLFMEDISTTNTAFVDSQKRRNYLKLSAAYVKSRGEVLLNVWDSSGQDYAALFTQNAGSGIDDSVNLFYNGIHNILDVTKTTKVGKPAGLENSQVINPELTQAYLSDTSIDLIKASIESAEEAYFGNGLSIDDYIFSIADNTQLNDAIQNKINEVYSAINALNRPFDQAITENQSQIATLHNHLEALRVLIAVDVQSIMSISITSTDTDGD